jgi:hypothetical protein
MTASIMHKDIAGILARHGLAKIDPNEWYPMQSVLDVMSDISMGENASAALISIGMAAAQATYDGLSEELKQQPLGDFLASYSQIYPTRARNGDSGWIKVEKLSEAQFVVTMKVPVPDDMFYGMFYAFTRLFRPKNKGFTVQYDDQVQRRDDGGDVTVMNIVVEG